MSQPCKLCEVFDGTRRLFEFPEEGIHLMLCRECYDWFSRIVSVRQHYTKMQKDMGLR